MLRAITFGPKAPVESHGRGDGERAGSLLWGEPGRGAGWGVGFYACASVIFTKRLQTGEYRLRAHVLTGEIDLE